MSKLKDKESKPFRFTFNHFIRLSVFLVVVYLMIMFLSSAKTSDRSNLNVLGAQTDSSNLPDLTPAAGYLWNLLPAQSRHTLETLDKNPVVTSAQKKLDELKNNASDFPQKQIKDIKISIVKSIYEDITRSINSQP
ncbi:MAG TPA: hypothetical protein VF828_04800 [Patescibacteria group bacterium]